MSGRGFAGAMLGLRVGEGREGTGENELDGNDEEIGGEAKTRPGRRSLSYQILHTIHNNGRYSGKFPGLPFGT